MHLSSDGDQQKLIKAHATVEKNGTKTYHITGQLFFGTMAHFVYFFDYKNDPRKVVIDFSSSHVWDHSAVTAIAKASSKYKQIGKQVTITDLNEESKKLVEQVGLAAVLGH